MNKVRQTTLPSDSLLASFAASDAYTDCYSVELPGQVSLADFLLAFYSTPIFKLERWILARALGAESSEDDVRRLASGESTRFAAWRVDMRRDDQIVLASGRTRSWLMVVPQSATAGKSTELYFGSAVLPLQRGGLGWQFRALLGFHRLYSRLLLGLATRPLSGAR